MPRSSRVCIACIFTTLMLTVATMLTSARPPAVPRGEAQRAEDRPHARTRTYRTAPHRRCAHHFSCAALMGTGLGCWSCNIAFAAAGSKTAERRTTPGIPAIPYSAPYCFGRHSPSHAMPHEDQGSSSSHGHHRPSRPWPCPWFGPASRVSRRLKVCHLCTPYYSPSSSVALHRCWRSHTHPGYVPASLHVHTAPCFPTTFFSLILLPCLVLVCHYFIPA
jgi:hypothetical protein